MFSINKLFFFSIKLYRNVQTILYTKLYIMYIAQKRKVSVHIFYHGIYGISLVVMLHGEHVAVLRNDLLVRDSAVVDRDGWNHVRGCGEGYALSWVVEGKRRNC